MATPPNAHDALAPLVLVCACCGNVLQARDMPMANLAVISQAASDIGWTGVERVGGPHYCPACAFRDPILG